MMLFLFSQFHSSYLLLLKIIQFQYILPFQFQMSDFCQNFIADGFIHSFLHSCMCTHIPIGSTCQCVVCFPSSHRQQQCCRFSPIILLCTIVIRSRDLSTKTVLLQSSVDVCYLYLWELKVCLQRLPQWRLLLEKNVLQNLFAPNISLGKALTTLEIALLFVGCHYCLRS